MGCNSSEQQRLIICSASFHSTCHNHVLPLHGQPSPSDPSRSFLSCSSLCRRHPPSCSLSPTSSLRCQPANSEAPRVGLVSCNRIAHCAFDSHWCPWFDCFISKPQPPNASRTGQGQGRVCRTGFSLSRVGSFCTLSLEWVRVVVDHTQSIHHHPRNFAFKRDPSSSPLTIRFHLFSRIPATRSLFILCHSHDPPCRPHFPPIRARHVKFGLGIFHPAVSFSSSSASLANGLLGVLSFCGLPP